MTRVAVAASIDNELKSRDFAAVKRLQQAGYDVQFFYYLPKVPPEFSMLPSFNEELREWRSHAIKMLDELGNKLEIPNTKRHFVDEVLGPDRVFDEAKELEVDVILTENVSLLSESLFSRFYDTMSTLFKRTNEKEVPVENISTYVSKTLGAHITQIADKKSAIHDQTLLHLHRKRVGKH